MQNMYMIVRDESDASYANHYNEQVWNTFYKSINRRWAGASIVCGLDIVDAGLPAVDVGLQKPKSPELNNALSHLIHYFLKYKLGSPHWDLKHINDDYAYRQDAAHCLDVEEYSCSVTLSAKPGGHVVNGKSVQKIIGKFEIELFLKCYGEDYEVWFDVKFDYGLFRGTGAIDVFSKKVTELNGYLDGEKIPNRFNAYAKDFMFIMSELGKHITDFEKKYDGKLSLEDLVIVPFTNKTYTCVCPYTGEEFRLLGSSDNSVCIDYTLPRARFVLLCGDQS